jgi:hypothetical protein
VQALSYRIRKDKYKTYYLQSVPTILYVTEPYILWYHQPLRNETRVFWERWLRSIWGRTCVTVRKAHCRQYTACPTQHLDFSSFNLILLVFQTRKLQIKFADHLFVCLTLRRNSLVYNFKPYTFQLHCNYKGHKSELLGLHLKPWVTLSYIRFNQPS